MEVDIHKPNNKNLAQIDLNKHKLLKIYPDGHDLVLCSQLIRTQNTAILYGYYDYKIDNLLNELNFGAFEGKKKKKMLEEYSFYWFECPEKLQFGESILDLEKRVRMFLRKYHEYENIIIFGHGAWLRALRAIVEYDDISIMNKVSIENNELVEVRLDSDSYKL